MGSTKFSHATTSYQIFKKRVIKDERNILFFDGNCGFCSRCVRFILTNEKKEILHFSSLQSDFAQKFLGTFAIESKDSETLYIYTEGKLYSKSLAVLKLIPFLRWYFFFCYLGYLIPRFVGDFFYDRIAKNRKRLFSSTCNLGEYSKSRFIA